MRLGAAIVGILLGILPLIFFWVGAQTFQQPGERALAIGMVLLTGTLLALSGALLFTSSVQRAQSLALLAVLGAIAAIWIWHRFYRSMG